MNVEIGTEATIFLFWEYLFQIFSIFSLQCTEIPVLTTEFITKKENKISFFSHYKCYPQSFPFKSFTFELA
jgi:hypothetical protein